MYVSGLESSIGCNTTNFIGNTSWRIEISEEQTNTTEYTNYNHCSETSSVQTTLKIDNVRFSGGFLPSQDFRNEINNILSSGLRQDEILRKLVAFYQANICRETNCTNK